MPFQAGCNRHRLTVPSLDKSTCVYMLVSTLKNARSTGVKPQRGPEMKLHHTLVFHILGFSGSVLGKGACSGLILHLKGA